MTSPIKPQDDNWWDVDVNRRETIWLGLTVGWAAILFGWMALWTRIGGQNQTGKTIEVSPDEFQSKVNEYKQNAEETDQGLIPPGDDVYIGAFRFNWDGLPAVLEAGKTYRFHLGSYDVQHGFSVRKEDTLSKQISLQVLPGYEWILEMRFDEPGTYQVVCNEFCGVGHRTMHGKFIVEE